ncbi:MAG: helix-turn-helix transcriptional regulator [Proteobacteria bacterium]|nr:helix-turn-helix transcriptional regulator [Pseudomonadota bacterium]
MEVVTAAGLELFAEKPSRQVTVVDIAKRASVARASMLLQFPDGISDLLAAAVNVEYERILDVEKQLWDRKPPKTVLDAMYRLVEAIHSRAVATGNLYANLLLKHCRHLAPIVVTWTVRLGCLARCLRFERVPIWVTTKVGFRPTLLRWEKRWRARRGAPLPRTGPSLGL